MQLVPLGKPEFGAGLPTPPGDRPQVSNVRPRMETFGRNQCGVGRPAHNKELQYLATDTRTPYVAEFDPADAGKTAYLATITG